MTNDEDTTPEEMQPKAEQPEMEEIEDKEENQIAKLENDIAELKAGWQRTQADFLNFRRQVEKDRARTIQMANADLIESILPVLDNFELAAKHVPEELKGNNWATGITMIEKQLFDVLKGDGLERIESLGQHFDPLLHEAIENVASDKPEGEIVEEAASGYRFNGIVLRPAKVKVSIGKAE